MKTTLRGIWVGLIALAALVQLGGCPIGVPPLEYVAGGGGESALITSEASVTVQTPASDLSIIGGTQVEVNWQAFATSIYATLHVIVDEDRTPDNGNETRAYSDLALTTRKALVDTTQLRQGTYNIGVLVEQFGETTAFGYAVGRIIVDQRPDLYFLTPRDNLVYDRTERINPTLDVAWELDDPDSTNTVNVYLDPDEAPNGNEILLYASESQTGDRFSFELPTSQFAAGTYRLLALVTDGRNATPFYMPGSIRLRARLAGPVDLRDMDLPETGISGAVFEGFNPRDNLGSFLSTAQDIDGDGFDDLILVAQFAKPNYGLNQSRTGIGEAYQVFGRADRFNGVVSVNSTGVLFRGDVYTGIPEVATPIRPSRGITSFAVLADWDSDGIREFAFGIPFCDSRAEPSCFLEQEGYFRSGGIVVVAVGSTQGGFPGGNVIRLNRIGTASVALSGTDTECPVGFEGPKAPSVAGGHTLFYTHYDATVPAALLGCRFSTVEFGDQCGESVAPYPFYGGFT